MNILLHENSLNLRGTSIALYDYAFWLKKIYNHNCIITYDKNNHTNNNNVIEKFQKEFDVIPYDQFNQVNNIIKTQNIDTFYIIKSGENDGKLSQDVKTCVHAVFPNDITNKHGDVYAYVSEWLSDICSKGILPFVPHMVNLPDTDLNYRKTLHIPEDAIVLGRYGGEDSFDIEFVKTTIRNILSCNNKIYFLFCNTFKFIDHPNAIFVNSTSSLVNKVKFINTCDALLHARQRGETFGLTILEFMSKQKPIITFGLSVEGNHYVLLDQQGIIYNNEEELYHIIKELKPHKVTYNKVDEYSPLNVIKKFNNIFLDKN